ncbi:MAG: hypothetical protein VX191_04950 [Candidatus Thermoplasmatota archaeon]|nr:hypothetical protein [Candidatus Thermoplasmatota archaeon]
MYMPRLGKAARGKHRWIGLRINQGGLTRDSAEALIHQAMNNLSFRLFDCKTEKTSTSVIIRVSLKDYSSARQRLYETDELECLTSSGKIRLVRQRLGLPRPIRKK